MSVAGALPGILFSFMCYLESLLTFWGLLKRCIHLQSQTKAQNRQSNPSQFQVRLAWRAVPAIVTSARRETIPDI